MTIKEFARRYTLHDSLVKKIEYDHPSKTLYMTVDFCWFMQDEYDERSPMPDIVQLVFSDVSAYDGLQGEIDDFSILWLESDENQITIALLDDFHDKLHQLRFQAENVSLTV